MTKEERHEVGVILGGDDVCFAHLLCEECGAVLDATHETQCPFRGASRETLTKKP